MAPTKFGIFKARSRDNAEQPSTENLLQSSTSSDHVNTPDSPVPSTSKGIMAQDMSALDIFSVLNIDDDDEEHLLLRVPDILALLQEPLSPVIIALVTVPKYRELSKIIYQNLQNESTGTSTMTLEDLDEIQIYEEPDKTLTIEDDASTSYDANSLQFDDPSIATSEDISMYCAMLKKPKKSRSKEQQLTDFDMWQASNVEVMQNLLRRSGTLDEQIKWEAIATSRGLCTLTDSCTCNDCRGAKYLAGISDGDGGLGAAPLFSAINVGCQVQ